MKVDLTYIKLCMPVKTSTDIRDRLCLHYKSELRSSYFAEILYMLKIFLANLLALWRVKIKFVKAGVQQLI